MALVKLQERRRTRGSINSAAVPSFKKSIGTGLSAMLTTEGNATPLSSSCSKSVSTMLSTVEVGK